MADGLRYELGGFQELERKLSALPGPAAKRVVMAGLRKGAQAVKAEAKRVAPVRQSQRDRIIPLGVKSTRTRSKGFLKRTIIYRAKRGELVVEVGPRRAAFYGKFFEFGRSGRSMPRNTWLTAAFQASADTALGRISVGLWDQLRKEVDKLGK